jgi:hypothetical protein
MVVMVHTKFQLNFAIVIPKKIHHLQNDYDVSSNQNKIQFNKIHFFLSIITFSRVVCPLMANPQW